MEWITVEAEDLEKKMGAPFHSTWRVWYDSDLVEVYKGGYYVSPGEARGTDKEPQARMFRIPQDVFERFTSLGDGSRRWWLHTAEPERTSEPAPMTTDLSDDNNHSYPWLIDCALRVLPDTQPMRVDEVRAAVESLAEKGGKEARAQKAGLQLALETIERQSIEEEDGVTRVQNAYTPTFGGRILFKRGGPQGMLGAVKARAYADIYGLKNYDIRSCHTTGLKEVADKLAEVGVDVDVSAWENYAGKYKVARRTGLPVTLVKITEHAIKYGAYLPASIGQAHKVFEGTHIDPEEDLKLVKAAKKYAEDPDEALGKLHDVFADMRRVIKQIAEGLLNEYYDAHHSGGYLHNACGVSFNPRDYREGHERETKVMAWMLQGLEAAFVHSLTIIGAQMEEFSVVANEHDGAIVEGEIPGIDEEGVCEVVRKAREMSGFHRAELVEKPHADEEDIQEVYGETEDEDDTEEVPEDQRDGRRAPGRTWSQEERSEETFYGGDGHRSRRTPSWAAPQTLPDDWEEKSESGASNDETRAETSTRR